MSMDAGVEEEDDWWRKVHCGDGRETGDCGGHFEDGRPILVTSHSNVLPWLTKIQDCGRAEGRSPCFI